MKLTRQLITVGRDPNAIKLGLTGLDGEQIHKREHALPQLPIDLDPSTHLTRRRTLLVEPVQLIPIGIARDHRPGGPN